MDISQIRQGKQIINDIQSLTNSSTEQKGQINALQSSLSDKADKSELDSKADLSIIGSKAGASSGSAVEGTGSNAEAINSHAEGNKTTAISNGAHAEGLETIAGTGVTRNITAYTANTITLDSASGIVVGDTLMVTSASVRPADITVTGISGTVVTFTGATGSTFWRQVIKRNPASGPAHAEGSKTIATGLNAHAEGFFTIASADNAHAEGVSTVASGQGAHTEGNLTAASTYYAHAEGNRTTASGEAAHSEGGDTSATARNAHAEGSSTLAAGEGAHAEGRNTVAQTAASHAEGMYSVAYLSNDGAIAITAYTTTTLTVDRIGKIVQGMTIMIITQDQRPISVSVTAVNTTSKILTISGATPAANWKWIVQKISFEGAPVHAEGISTLAVSAAAHAQGRLTVASGAASHAEGDSTVASGFATHSQGFNTIASPYASHAMGQWNKLMTGSETAYQATADAFVIGNGTSAAARNNAFRVTFDGKTYGLSAFNSTGADYGEFFEWLDGNPDGEDRVGFIVTLDGDKIRKANSTDTFILGIISATASVIGDSHDDWHNKFLTDQWGRIQYEYIDVPATVMTVHHEAEIGPDEVILTEAYDELVEISPAVQSYVPIINPDWNEELEYIRREDRKEWSVVGMMGKLLVRDDGTCTVNGYCNPNDDGIATNSTSGYRVMKRISENIVQVLVK